uniref:Uncharacterized protein n=1 Tax=Anguilla anguilla TaxID=7936 RepID=A0A0E9WWZ7_ANGAN
MRVLTVAGSTRGHPIAAHSNTQGGRMQLSGSCLASISYLPLLVEQSSSTETAQLSWIAIRKVPVYGYTHLSE